VSNPEDRDFLFILDEPHYHNVRFGETHRIRGLALATEGPEIESIRILREGEVLLETPTDLPSMDIGQLVSLPKAAGCRFAGELRIERGPALEFRARRADGGEVPLFSFDVPLVESAGERLAGLRQGALRLPLPPPELVERTQGGSNQDAYRDSILSGILTAEALLKAAGTDMGEIRTVLDIGCGTGRLLAGYHLADPRREMVGVDIQPELVTWAEQSLPDVARWLVGPLSPPLDLPSASFDLVQLVSVFTHLPLALQRAWLEEIRRLLKPGGWALVTLHGTIYASLLLGPAPKEVFELDRYLEAPGGPAGSNPFATFHHPDMARDLFQGFDRIVLFPRGQLTGGTPRLFPVASLQDVYLLRAAG
jgi:SAM-dependent methyltransferase